MTRQQVVDFIFKTETADLEIIMQAAQLRRAQLAQRIRTEIIAGDTVSFTSAKKRAPYTYTAVLVDKRQTRATVRITGPSYGKYPVGSSVTVPFAMLKKV
jgi:hypothetical protein